MGFWDGADVLVTGGAGFIGSHLCEQLSAAGAAVCALDNLSTGRRENLAALDGTLELIDLDARGAEIESFLAERRFDVVFHLSANAYTPPSVEDPIYDFDSNLRATLRVLEALRRAKRDTLLLYASSAAVYGESTGGPIGEDHALAPISPYGVSKLAAERYVAVYSRLYGMRAASARFFSTYGPRQRKQVVFDFIAKLGRDPERMSILGDGRQRRDFNFVADTVRGLLCIAEAGECEGEVYNVASGRSVSIDALAREVARARGLEPRFVCSGAARAGDPHAWVADVSRLRRLGYEPAYDLARGVAATLAWFEQLPLAEQQPLVGDDAAPVAPRPAAGAAGSFAL